MEAGGEENPDLIADGWERVRPGAFIELIGPFYVRRDEGRVRFCFRVQHKHDNTQGRPHGGMILSFLDEALGLSAHFARPGDICFTVSFDCQLIGGSVVGDLVVAETELVSATRSMMFMRGTCRVGDRVIATANGIWKRVAGKNAPGG